MDSDAHGSRITPLSKASGRVRFYSIYCMKVSVHKTQFASRSPSYILWIAVVLYGYKYITCASFSGNGKETALWKSRQNI